MTWIFSALLAFGILTLRVPGRWALTAFEVGMFALAIGIIARRRAAIAFHPIGALLAAAAVWGALQIAIGRSADVQHTSEAVLHWMVNCAAFSIAVTLPRRKALAPLLIFALLVAIFAVISFFTVGVLGPFVYRNQFAAYLEPMLGIAISFAIADRRRTIAWILVAAALFAAVVAGGSRAGSIICLGELIVIPLVAYAQGKITGIALARVATISVIAAGALVAVVGWETIWDRLQEPHPLALRADLTQSSLEMTRDRPIFGFGLGTWSDAYPAYAHYDDGTFVNQAHNDWAQWLSEGGVPFLVIMVALVGMLVRPAYRTLWGIGLLAVFLHCFVDYPMQQRPALAAYFFALAGFLAP